MRKTAVATSTAMPLRRPFEAVGDRQHGMRSTPGTAPEVS